MTTITTTNVYGAVLSEFGDGSASKIDSFVHSGNCPDRVGRAYLAVATDAERAEASAEAARTLSLTANREALDARDQRAAREQSEGVTADQRAAARRAEAKARDRANEASKALDRALRDRDGQQRLLAALGTAITPHIPRPDDSGVGRLASDREPSMITRSMALAPEPRLPSTGKLAEFIAEARATQTGLRAKRGEIIAAPEPAEVVKQRLRATISANASAGRIGVDEGRLVWPTRALDVVTPTAARARVIDVEAVLCGLFGDRIIEEAERAVDESYAGVELTLDAGVRRERLREIDAALLASERAECAAVLALIDSGDEAISFRPDANPRAVLGLA